MAIAEPGPASFAALRGAMLKGHEPPPLQAVARLASYRWVVVATVCVGAFMGQVDASLTQMLLPRLERDFHAPLSTVSWVAVAYILTMASFMPIFGRLADMIGRKLLYTGAFLLFVIGSGLCGFAPDLPTLIAFRIVQGIGAALMTANSIAIVVLAAGPEHRGRALGLQSAAQAIGLGVGPAVGGLVLDTLGWHWAFWINVPFGLLGLLLGWFVLPQTRHLKSGGRFDWHGAFLIAPALTAIVALLNEGHAWGVTSPAFISCSVAAVILLALFVLAERRADHAADRLRAAAPARLPDRQPRELPVLRRAVRRVLPHPLRAGPRLPGLRARRGPPTLDRAGDAGPVGAGRRHALRPLRCTHGDGGGHGGLRRGACRALRLPRRQGGRTCRWSCWRWRSSAQGRGFSSRPTAAPSWRRRPRS